MSNQGCYASHAGKSPRNSSSTVVLHSSFQPFLVGGAPGLATKKWIWNTSTTMWCRGFAGCFRSHISHIYRSLILIYDLAFGFNVMSFIQSFWWIQSTQLHLDLVALLGHTNQANCAAGPMLVAKKCEWKFAFRVGMGFACFAAVTVEQWCIFFFDIVVCHTTILNIKSYWYYSYVSA